MTRQSRMIIIIAVMALVGVVVLGFLARKYHEKLQPEAAQESPVVSRSAETTDLDPKIQGFLAGRKAVLAFLDENPPAKDSLCAEIRNDTADRDQVKMYNSVLWNLRVKRNLAASAQGLDEAGYAEVREYYRLWRSGDATLDGAWKAALDAREKDLAEIDMGDCDPLDY